MFSYVWIFIRKPLEMNFYTSGDAVIFLVQVYEEKSIDRKVLISLQPSTTCKGRTWLEHYLESREKIYFQRYLIARNIKISFHDME